MSLNHLYYQNNINNNMNSIYQNNIFKDFDNEIYTINDLNLKKISDIIREVQNKKDIEKPYLSIDKKEHSQKLSDSMKKINELYYNIFDIKDMKKKYENQKEKKYQQFKKFINIKNKRDKLQRFVDDSLIANLKKLKELNKEEKEKIEKKEETIDSEKGQQNTE